MSRSISSAILLLCLCLSVSGDPARFDNHVIYNVPLENDLQVKEMQKLSLLEKFDFVYEPHRVGQELKVFVSPEQKNSFESLCNDLGLKPTVLVDNVQRLVDKEMDKPKSRADGFALDEFHRLDEIYAWLDSLAETYPDIVTRIKGGDSYEGRSIEGIKISKNPNNPAIFVDANIHANEWITSSSVLWIINALLTSSDPEIVSLTENFNWYILPMCNPDGYEFTHTTYRMWRKTRSRQGMICYGVDPNRNFDFMWLHTLGTDMITTDPCGNTYAGPAPFSEVEVRSLAEFVESLKEEVKIAFSVHSAINMLLSPWGYTDEKPENHEDFMEILEEGFKRLNAVHGMVYKYGTSYETIYPNSGTTTDYFYGALGIPLAFTLELRDQTSDGEFYGFIPPPEEIEPNAEEILQAIIGMISKAGDLGYFDE